MNRMIVGSISSYFGVDTRFMKNSNGLTGSGFFNLTGGSSSFSGAIVSTNASPQHNLSNREWISFIMTVGIQPSNTNEFDDVAILSGVSALSTSIERCSSEAMMKSANCFLIESSSFSMRARSASRSLISEAFFAMISSGSPLSLGSFISWKSCSARILEASSLSSFLTNSAMATSAFLCLRNSSNAFSLAVSAGLGSVLQVPEKTMMLS